MRKNYAVDEDKILAEAFKRYNPVTDEEWQVVAQAVAHRMRSDKGESTSGELYVRGTAVTKKRWSTLSAKNTYTPPLVGTATTRTRRTWLAESVTLSAQAVR